MNKYILWALCVMGALVACNNEDTEIMNRQTDLEYVTAELMAQAVVARAVNPGDPTMTFLEERGWNMTVGTSASDAREYKYDGSQQKWVPVAEPFKFPDYHTTHQLIFSMMPPASANLTQDGTAEGLMAADTLKTIQGFKAIREITATEKVILKHANTLFDFTLSNDLAAATDIKVYIDGVPVVPYRMEPPANNRFQLIISPSAGKVLITFCLNDVLYEATLSGSFEPNTCYSFTIEKWNNELVVGLPQVKPWVESEPGTGIIVVP